MESLREFRQVLRFDRYTFHPDTLELRLGDEPVALPPTASRILRLLLRRRGALATRADLKNEGWPGAPAEADESLNTCIKQIRAALGDDARTPRFVATIHRRGYRMIPAVEDALDPGSGRTGYSTADGRRAALDESRPAASPGRWVGRTLATWSRRGAAAVALAAAFLAGRQAATITATPLPPAVHFETVGMPDELGDIDDRLRDAVGRHLSLSSAPGSEAGGAEVLITGVVTPAPDGADLRARIVRVSDGTTLWSGAFNPYCPDAPGDPVDIIGRYLARTAVQIHRT